MEFETLLNAKKYTLFGQCDTLQEAYAHAFEVLSDSHRHDICEAIDLYHNTLIEEIRKLYKECQNNAQLQNVH